MASSDPTTQVSEIPSDGDDGVDCNYQGDSTTLDVTEDDEHDPSTALAPGDPVGLLSTPALALYVLSIVVTFLQNVLPPLKLYIFLAYLHGSPQDFAQLTALENLAWTLRVPFAVLSDCLPLGGHRRKAWLVLGWLVTIGSVAAMTFAQFGAPFCDPSDFPKCWNPAAKATPMSAYDFAAPSRVAWFRAPTFAATLGVTIVTASVDGLLVEYAQREPLATRGQIQAVVFALTGSGGLAARFFLQLMLNGKRYGGSYDWSVGAAVPYAISLGVSVVALAVVVLVVRETARPRVSVSAWVRGLSTLLQNRAVWQLLAFRFLYYLCNNVYGRPLLAFGVPLVRWVTDLDMGWINITPRLVFVPATVYAGQHGLHWNWRLVLATATFANIALMALAAFLVIYDVCRNAWVYTAIMVLTGVPAAFNYLFQGLMMVELAAVGYEATTAALWATVKDLNGPIAAKWHTYITDQFPVKSMLLLDDDHTRNQVAYTHLIAFGIQLVGLVWFVLVPTQKIPMQALKSLKASRVGALGVVLAYVALMAFSWQQNIHSYNT